MFNHFLFWLDICLASKQNSDLQDWKRNFEISSPPPHLELKRAPTYLWTAQIFSVGEVLILSGTTQ
jgi:hypothetical protein